MKSADSRPPRSTVPASAPHPAPSSAPAAPPPVAATRMFNIPEHDALKRLRELTAVGLGARTPEDSVRRALFRFLTDFLRMAAELKRRIERGERCRIVEEEQRSEPGMLRIILRIETIAEP